MSGSIPDLVNDLARTQLHAAARRINGTYNSSGIDISKVGGWGLFLVFASLGVGTTPTLDFTIQTSDDDGVADAYAAIAANLRSGSFTQVTAAAGNGMQVVGVDLTGCEKWVRLQAVVAAANGQGFEFASVLVAVGRPNLARTSV